MIGKLSYVQSKSKKWETGNMCEENNESFNDETHFKRIKQWTFSQQVQ